MRSHLLNKKFIFADETTVQVRQEQDQSSQSKSYMWVYRSGEFVEQPIAIYDYQPNRTGQCMKDFFIITRTICLLTAIKLIMD